MIEMFNSLIGKAEDPIYNPNGTLKGINWDLASSPAGGFTVTDNVLTAININHTAYAAFGPILPKESFYYDIEISSGYELGTASVGFIGICNNVNATNWSQNINTDPNIITWYWSGRMYGISNPLSAQLTPLIGGKYRFAFNFETKRFYMSRISPNPAAAVWVSAPSFTDDLRILCHKQGMGYATQNTTTIHEIGLGSGGLY